MAVNFYEVVGQDKKAPISQQLAVRTPPLATSREAKFKVSSVVSQFHLLPLQSCAVRIPTQTLFSNYFIVLQIILVCSKKPFMSCFFYISFDLICLFFKLLKPSGFKEIIGENLVLRQQLIAVRRIQKKAPRLIWFDRIVFGLMYFLIKPSRLAGIAIVIKPSTILAFHRALVKRKYQKLFGVKGKRKPGPKGPSKVLIEAIVDLKTNNPRYGYQKIADLLASTFGVEVDKGVVARVLRKHFKYDPSSAGGPSWLVFVGLLKDSLYSIDLFRCESVDLKSYWVLVVMDQ